MHNNCTQTFDIAERESNDMCSIATQTEFNKGTTALKVVANKKNKSIAESSHGNCKEDAHLMATIRGMRVDLAIKEKALQRLTRELDDCKKTIRKLQKEKEGFNVLDNYRISNLLFFFC